MLNHAKVTLLQTKEEKKSAIQEDFWTNSLSEMDLQRTQGLGMGQGKWPYFTLQVNDL